MLYASSKPYARWWWFAGEIREDVIRYQLDWAKQNGFGGVEIAWLYPQPTPPAGQAAPGPQWLSAEWSRMVAYAKQYADQIGLGCDFTFGTSWPFGGSIVPEQDATRVFSPLSDDGVPSPQRLEKSWEWPFEGYILNHLDAGALERYTHIMGGALAEALQGSRSALFCDSWEVAPEQLWGRGFGTAFKQRFGYAIEDYMPAINANPDERYDYRKLLADGVLDGFYRPFTALCHRLGADARVQCHGAPTDLLAAYAAVDVPESEAILFDPEFSTFAASAAALAGKPVVSAEAFTCLYGWVAKPGPGPFQMQEQMADIKLVADALFANGVNQIVWHGMPCNPPGGDTRFYATVHVGPESAFAAEISAFNASMAKVCAMLRRGVTYSDVAVYMPIEDMWMSDELPRALQKPSAQYYWEMQYVRPPESLKGYHPLWVSTPFLKQAQYEGGMLRCGEAVFTALYVDVEWLDREGLDELLRLARQGLPICLNRRPKEPGRLKSAGYGKDVTALMGLRNVSADFGAVAASPRLVRGYDLPDFWCRRDGDDFYMFFANPKARGLRYPLTYGQSFNTRTVKREIELNLDGKRRPLTLMFEPYQSVLLHASRQGDVDLIDVTFEPNPPVVVQ